MNSGLIVEIGQFDISKFELAAAVDFRLQADVAVGVFQARGLPGRLAVDLQFGRIAHDGELEVVPLAALDQAAALGSLERADVAFVALLQIDLIAGRPGLALGRQIGADVNARVVVGRPASLPVEFEHEVAVALVGAHEAVARFEHQQSVLDRRVAAGDLPTIEIPAVEQRGVVMVGGQRGAGGSDKQSANRDNDATELEHSHSPRKVVESKQRC